MADIQLKPEHQRIAEILTAAENFAAEVAGMDSLGPLDHFTCSEAEALAEFMDAVGGEEARERVIYAHAAGDEDPTDQHHDLYLEVTGKEPAS